LLQQLVTFDPVKLPRPRHGVPELAEKWSWQDGYKNLVFFLRKTVTWHDGRPFTSKDVKFTFDMVREAPDAAGKLRVNPRKDWYGNVEAIETPDPSTVVFRLRRPQPSLLLMPASGDSPVYPAHVAPADQRTRCVGTGPFKLKEWKRGEYVDYVKNPDYFVKGRPYLDGIRYLIVNERGTRTAALQAGRADAASPLDSSPQIAAQLKAAVPGMVITRVGAGNAENLLLNTTKPPFNDVRVRRALSRAVDRQAFIKAVLQGSGIPGGAMPAAGRLLGSRRHRPRRPQRQGGGAAAPRLRRLHGVESAAGRGGDTQPRHLPRHGVVRAERAEAGRRGGQPALHRHRGVVRDHLA
jgi:peptide/nickel transport system substrate-binding protein